MTSKPLTAPRTVLILDALVFLTAAALNFGARIPLGLVTVAFPVRIIQVGIGEGIIGAALLAAGISLRRGLAWLAFWLSVGGVALGLVATTARRGPGWDVFVILVPLVLILVGVLIWTNRGSEADRVATASRATPKGIVALMAVTAGTLLVASAIHFGTAMPLVVVTVHDPFAGAAIPEAVLGVLLALGAAFLASGRPGSREMAVAAAIFTLLLSLYGLYTTRGVRTGDVVYHISLIALLAGIIVWLLVLRSARHARSVA